MIVKSLLSIGKLCKYILLAIVMVSICQTIAYTTDLPTIRQPLWSIPFPPTAQPYQLIASKNRLIVSTIDRDNSYSKGIVGAAQGVFIIDRQNSNARGEPQLASISALTPTKTLWTFAFPAHSEKVGEIAISDGVVLVKISEFSQMAEEKYRLIALKANTGQMLWQRTSSVETQTKVLGNTVYTSFSVRNRPDKKFLQAVDLQTGRELWTNKQLGGSAILSSNDRVFIVEPNQPKNDPSTHLIAIDRQTGKQLREIDIAGDLSKSVLANHIIYAVTFNPIEGGPPRGGSRRLVNSWVNAYSNSKFKAGKHSGFMGWANSWKWWQEIPSNS